MPHNPELSTESPSLRLVSSGPARDCNCRDTPSLVFAKSITPVQERDAAKDRSWQWTLVWPNVDRIHGSSGEPPLTVPKPGTTTCSPLRLMPVKIRPVGRICRISQLGLFETNTQKMRIVSLFTHRSGVWRRGEIGKGWDCDTWPQWPHSKHVWNIPSRNLLQTNDCTRNSRHNAIALRPLRAIAAHELLHELPSVPKLLHYSTFFFGQLILSAVT